MVEALKGSPIKQSVGYENPHKSHQARAEVFHGEMLSKVDVSALAMPDTVHRGSLRAKRSAGAGAYAQRD
jgi:hypothetical protein